MRVQRLVMASAAAMIVAAGCGDRGGENAQPTDDDMVQTTATVSLEELDDSGVEREAQLREVDDSGVQGTATVESQVEGELRVVIELEGDDGTTRAATVRQGSCDQALEEQSESEGDTDTTSTSATDIPVIGDEADIGSGRTFDLEPVEDGRSETNAELPAALVTEGAYALLVHEDEEAGSAIAACAEVEVVDDADDGAAAEEG